MPRMSNPLPYFQHSTPHKTMCQEQEQNLKETVYKVRNLSPFDVQQAPFPGDDLTKVALSVHQTPV